MIDVDEYLIDELVEIIYHKIEEKFDKKLNKSNVEFSAEGIVKKINYDDSDTPISYGVELSFNMVDELPNLSGVDLSINDKVKVFYRDSSLSGAYIGVRF